jgi:hypothetical protein
MWSLAIKKNGQSTLEQALLISIIAVGLISGGLYISRSMKANLKMVEKQINEGVKVVPPYTSEYEYMKQECKDLCLNGGQGPDSQCMNFCGTLNAIFTGSCIGSHCGSLSGTEKASCIEYCLGKWGTANDCVTSCIISGENTCMGSCMQDATDWPWKSQATPPPTNTNPTVSPEVTNACWEECSNEEDVGACMRACTSGG